MPHEYHELNEATLVQDVATLTNPRTIALLREITESRRQYKLIDVYSADNANGGTTDAIVFDIAVEGVPSQNKIGIAYRERLALFIDADPRKQIEVNPLRKNFPETLHQNQFGTAAPNSLCLTAAPPAVVASTWTAKSFLKSIAWWLEETSKGTLHLTDQPVEQMFFSTNLQLVLPKDFEFLSDKVGDKKYLIYLGTKRPDGGITCFLVDHLDKPMKGFSTLSCFEFALPPVVHRPPIRDPRTLGQLADIVKKTGVNLIENLSTEILKSVTSKGTPAKDEHPFVIILLHFPITREGSNVIERTETRAYATTVGSLQLGEQIGALFSLDGRYFDGTGVLSKEESTSWRNLSIDTMEVYKIANSELLRRQSGISELGPKGTLIGAGALGSALINLWARAGWGTWTVIDNDYIKPHNLARHIAHAEQVGDTKVDVLNAHGTSITGSDFTVQGIFSDAESFQNTEVLDALKDSSIVIDASTTLSYPRKASITDDLGRHISIFLTPDGRGSVLLAEDKDRSIRVRSLEAQYYRAIIQQAWGAAHLTGNLSKFWTGANCRDLSVVMPLSNIEGHASTLSEQIRLATLQDNARIRVWEKDFDSGAVTFHEIEPYEELSWNRQLATIYMDRGVEAQLRAFREKELPNETGGVLLGYFDFNVDAIVIVCALPAPPDSESSPTHFIRGHQGLLETVQDIGKRTAGIVRYLGEWHSHPRGFNANPSGDDIHQLGYLAIKMHEDGLPAIQLIVGENDIQVHLGKQQ